MADLRVAVIQQGARRNYIYARQLEEAGLLGGLFCDAAFPEEPGFAARVAANASPRLRAAIARRTLRGGAASKLHASILPNLVALAGGFLHAERMYPLADEAMALRFARRAGVLDADVVVNYHGNGGSLLDRAKRRGARILTDFVITPAYLEIEQAERARWPGWEAIRTSRAVIDEYRARMERLVRLSDMYLCPSQAVARDLAHLDGFDASKVRINPYGVSGVQVSPRATATGRVLFAGAAGLRKGIPYLAEAARILKQRGAAVDIVVAGRVEDAVRRRPEVEALTFLGMLGRDAMADEFARADVFCLPSLAEGSATSIFEALANGLPVVTTAASGSVVTDGLEGLIVPERDAAALALAIERIVEDRDLRNGMSRAAEATAAVYDDDACGRRFIDLVREAGRMNHRKI